ncbi:glutaminyl-peptide cyclotransferase [Alistipes sp.]|uniref:glutaminyl-peptide cyclotransferase n=1 Tax=Alistipes sp. TaxID=1872444 RepID=UPI003AEF9FD4
MKASAYLLSAALFLTACGGPARAKRPAAEPQPAPAEYTYRIRAVYPHSRTAYTQGLFYADGLLWEGTGQHGESVLRTTDLETGRSRVVARLPRSEFGEGIALLGGEVFQLTWQSNTAHVWDAATGRKLREHRYPGEGWGLTTDGRKLYMSDGTANIYTVDPASFRREKTTTVTFEGRPVNYLNELEWIEGKIWANVYTTDQVVILDPATGRVEGVVDLTGLLPDQEATETTDVLNGIAYDADAKRIFLTGKNWPKLYEIEIIRK